MNTGKYSIQVNLPSRISLVEQTAIYLREQIRSDKWNIIIPGERALSQQLGVSRWTIRAALDTLKREKLLSSQPKQSSKIISKRRRAITSTKKVTILSGMDLQLRENAVRYLFSFLTAGLQNHDIQTEVYTHPSLESRTASQFLDKFVDRRSNHYWVLFSVSEEVQKWFSDRSIPAIVAGSNYKGIKLPSFDIDHRAVGRHAASNLIKSGHRRIVLASINHPRAGDIECNEGFMEGVEQAKGKAIEARILTTNRNPDHLCSKLRYLLHSSSAPTALIVGKVNLALTAFTYALSQGIRIPEKLSIMATDSEVWMEFVRPAIARYEINEESFAKRLFALTLNLVQSGHLSPEKHLFFPQFIPGGSISRNNKD